MTNSKPKSPYMGHRQRLRQRFIKSGVNGFQDYEVLELLLTFAIPRIDTKPLAKRLLKKFGSLARVLDAIPQELREIKGIGLSASVFLPVLRSAMELYFLEKAKSTDIMNSPDVVVRYCRAALEGERNEIFMCLYLSSKNRILHVERLSEGTIDQAAVYPRRIIEGCLKANAAAVIFVHNHPSGDPTPSTQDRLLTTEIKTAAKPLGIEIHDHIIIGQGAHFSFKTQGLM